MVGTETQNSIFVFIPAALRGYDTVKESPKDNCNTDISSLEQYFTNQNTQEVKMNAI